MKIKYLLIIPVLFGITFCSTTPATPANLPDTDISGSVDESAETLNEIRDLVEKGSLTSLKEAINLLESNSAGLTEQGENFKYIAGSLLKLVYPYSVDSSDSLSIPKSNILAGVVENAEKGIIIDLPSNEVSFFTLLLSSTAVLHTESEAVSERSLEILRTLYSEESDSFLPVFIYAYISEKEKKFDKATEGYKKALELDKNSYPPLEGLVRIYLRNGEYQRALVPAKILYTRYKDKLIFASLMVDALIGSGNLEKALLIVSDSLAANPDDMTMTLKYADILQREGNLTQARRILKVVESISGQTGEYIRIYTSILAAEKNYSYALELLGKALSLEPDKQDLVSLYGKILLLAGKEGEGRIYLESSLENNPDSLENLGLLLEDAVSMKEWSRASELIDRLLTKNSSDLYLRYAVTIYRNLGDLTRAFNYNNKIVHEGSPVYEDYYNQIKFYLEQGRNLKAIDEVDRWIAGSTDPVERSSFYYLRSLTQPDIKGKLDSLRQALFENLRNLDAVVAIADAYYKLGEKRKSYRYLKQALIMVPDNEGIKEKLRNLEGEL
ncbi:MAG: hypothetical protein L3J12_10085 [Spirochaetales bacterium]|nr:hypothetical protein [Spirochaetales bacterium]